MAHNHMPQQTRGVACGLWRGWGSEQESHAPLQAPLCVPPCCCHVQRQACSTARLPLGASLPIAWGRIQPLQALNALGLVTWVSPPPTARVSPLLGPGCTGTSSTCTSDTLVVGGGTLHHAPPRCRWGYVPCPRGACASVLVGMVGQGMPFLPAWCCMSPPCWARVVDNIRVFFVACMRCACVVCVHGRVCGWRRLCSYFLTHIVSLNQLLCSSL